MVDEDGAEPVTLDGLRRIPPRLFKVERLQELWLTNQTRLLKTGLPPKLPEYWPQLRILCISGCGLEELPLVRRLPSPRATDHAPNLSILAVPVPQVVTQLASLRCLYASRNKISTLPQELTKLEQLRELNLRKNEIEVFPAVVQDLPRLEVLNLADNELLTELPFSFSHSAGARGLVELDLAGTNVSQETADASVFELPHCLKLAFGNAAPISTAADSSARTCISPTRTSSNLDDEDQELLDVLYTRARRAKKAPKK
mmetsp:Transcript_23253/g.72689  ORF Transcript_23253/g.72689 Transcript_23253/m.72689 type:complete len:258 (+) Transcript_23253:565-1338(+)